MNDSQLLRYSRHILLDEIGIEGQQRLLDSKALVVGAGGLGSPVALYLASAGVGHITLVDHDTVELTNLQRQIAHTQTRLGQTKVQSAKTAMAGINPDVVVTALAQRATPELLATLVRQHDVVFDCTDNFITRHAINAACVAASKPLVSGAAIRFDGQISVYNLPGEPALATHGKGFGAELQVQSDAQVARTSPCYACVFPPSETFEETACATMGVLAPLVGIIGTLQAAEGIKLLSGTGHSLSGRLLMLDGLSLSFSEIRVARDPACPVCSGVS